MQETLQNHNALLNEIPESLGSTLTRARLSRKLEVREAANRIGVDMSVVQALEDDDFQRLGAPVFARNFLTRYARLLELPEQEILERFRQMGLDEPPPLKVERPIQRQARMTDIRWLAYPVVVVGVLWLSYLGFERLNVHYSSDTAQSPPAEQDGVPPSFAEGAGIRPGGQADDPVASPSANPVAPALAAIADLAGFDDDPGDEPAAGSTAPAEAPSPPTVSDSDTTDEAGATSDDVAAPPLAEPLPRERESLAMVDLLSGETGDEPDNLVATTPAPGGSGNEAPLVAVANLAELNDDDALDDSDAANPEFTALPAGQAQLMLSFDDDCWVEVRDASGERLVRSILNANTVNRFVGEPPFSLTLGNAAAVTSITLNGEPVDESVYAPNRGNVSRFTLEAPSG